MSNKRSIRLGESVGSLPVHTTAEVVAPKSIWLKMKSFRFSMSGKSIFDVRKGGSFFNSDNAEEARREEDEEEREEGEEGGGIKGKRFRWYKRGPAVFFRCRREYWVVAGENGAEKKEKTEFWNVMLFGLGSISNLYLPVGDLCDFQVGATEPRLGVVWEDDGIELMTI